MGSKKISVFVVDDSNIMIEGFIKIVQGSELIDYRGKAHTGEECLEKTKNKDLDIILMDIDMPGMNGIETAKKIIERREGNTPRIIFLTVHGRMDFIQEAMGIGASYLGKNIGADDLVKSIQTIHEGGIVINAPKTEKKEGKREEKERKRKKILGTLTKRQLEIVCMVAKGFSSKQIGSHLNGITEQTVNTHRRNILARLQEFDVGNTASLVAMATEYNLCMELKN